MGSLTDYRVYLYLSCLGRPRQPVSDGDTDQQLQRLRRPPRRRRRRPLLGRVELKAIQGIVSTLFGCHLPLQLRSLFSLQMFHIQSKSS